MITHNMKLYNEPFNLIKSGNKIYELRLYDEKRQLLKTGDIIEFTHFDDPAKKLNAEVMDILRFDSFSELYDTIPQKEYGCSGWSMEELLSSTYEIYTPEDEKKYGTVAIKIKLIKA